MSRCDLASERHEAQSDPTPAGERRISFMRLEPGEFPDSIEDEAKRLDWRNSQDNCLTLVAEQGGRLIGALSVYRGETRRARHRTTFGMGVALEHWSRGAGAAMLQYALHRS